jgi:hypothetical protein
LGQRPNVKPWYTNEYDDDEDDEVEDEDESYESMENNNVMNIDSEIADILDVQHNSRTVSLVDQTIGAKRSQVINLSSSEESSVNMDNRIETYSTVSNMESTTTQSSSNNNVTCSSSSSTRKDNRVNVNERSTSSKSKNKPKVVKKKPKLSPTAALSIQQSLYRNNQNQINTKKKTSKMTDVLVNEQKEREFIMETRQTKLKLDLEKHNDMKKFEMKKINLEEKRLSMEEEERDLKREHLKVQTTLEKNKALLVKMEIFKMRQAIKKADPTVTDEFLDGQFPY